MQVELLHVDAVFDLADPGLVCAPSFPGPATGQFDPFTATVQVQPPGLPAFDAEATFSATHFRLVDATEPAAQHWQILMCLAGVAKDAVPRGSRIFADDAVARRVLPGPNGAGLDHAAQVEKAFRSFLRARASKLAALTLPEAFDAMSAFWAGGKDGAGIAAYQDVTAHGRGTRLEIGFDRIMRSAPDRTALRLRLRVGYKWDMDVVRHVLPAGMWSFTCWQAAEFDAFRQAVLDTAGFSFMREKKPAEVNITCDTIAWP